MKLSKPIEEQIAPVRDRMLALPGQPGFDPWCLTDSVAYAKLYDNPKAIEAIAALWKCDPEPEKTLAIQTEIIAALWWGDIAFPLTPFRYSDWILLLLSLGTNLCS
ncbi:MAG: hypothetical protein HC935_02285 [Pseudanabaena sp. SU_2_4]|nr:hypothetical protein [Pseudanabaena sp. SU_2_4]